MSMQGIGQRGEIQTTRIGTESNVDIPWRVAVRASLSLCACYTFGLTILVIVWSAVHWPSLWQHVNSRIVRLWLVPYPLVWIVVFSLLTRYDHIPRLKNAEWPPPYAQVDPMKAGLLTAENWDDRREIPDLLDASHTVYFEGSISNGNGKSLHHRLATDAPDAWQNYARALTSGVIKAPFSVRAARRFGVPDDEFTNLANGWVSIGFAEKTSSADNAHRRLTPYGRAYMAGLADQQV